MRFERALCAVALVGAIAGCSSSSSDEPRFSEPSATAAGAAAAGSAPAWTEPGGYSFVLTRGCDPAKPLGRYQATVKSGQVTDYSRVGASAADPGASAAVDLGPITGDEGEEIEVPSLGQLVEMAQTSADDGGEVNTEYDATDGHPVKVTINVSDDPGAAECFLISDYKAG
ncbi:hypothetical protein GCM10010168_90070 [Actinoplanes ianthinogenes]|uniref:Lipoprotein n=1 Tax=Actinoplanes ianthinogenes TaxID=122358 RepID=A0ABM7M1S2_9ACTN|nr:hypothetical protein [Actinoplanes ianthinogenes]BCJ45589.1 hypothetical protein Aiant_62460 [Actinoplanes ianthinogenes]GGR57135.1 hypothetical protein GCM10010168_90070 [Actinoplanes ianthinogenes]